MQFDLLTLYEMLNQRLHAIDGSFGSSMIDQNDDYGDDAITVQMDDGAEYDIIEIVREHEQSGILEVKTKDGEILIIQFFRVASLDEASLDEM